MTSNILLTDTESDGCRVVDKMTRGAAKLVNEGDACAFRVHNGEFQSFDGDEWEAIGAGCGQISLWDLG